MKRFVFAIVIGLTAFSVTHYAHAAACVNGVYRAGCTGPNGTAVVRKAPVRKPVTCANGVYRAGYVGPHGAAVVRDYASDVGGQVRGRGVGGTWQECPISGAL